MVGNDSSWRPDRPVVDREFTSTEQLSAKNVLDVLRRRRLIAGITFAVVCALGLLLLLITRPLYQARVQLLVENRLPATTTTSSADPYSNVLLTRAEHTVETQVEVLRSTNLIQRVADQTKVDPRSVQVNVRQLGKTELAELTVTSGSREAANKFATALPDTYLQDLRQSRITEVGSGLSLARRRLREREAHLARAERALELYKASVGVVDPQAERTEDINAAAIARANAGQAAGEAASAEARLRALRSARSRMSSFVSTPVTVTNPETMVLRERIAGLREERSRLLFLYKPQSDEVRRMDVSISALERRLANTPRATTTVTRAPNPAVAELDAKIADTVAQYRAAQASWARAINHRLNLENSLSRYNAIERQQAGLQRTIDQARNAVELLSRSVEEMSLRETAARAAGAPLRVVGVTPAEKIAPRPLRHLLVTLLLAALLACAVAFIQESLDDRIRSEEEVRGAFDLPILGHLPHSGNRNALLSPGSAGQLIERYRLLRANIQLPLEKCCDRSLLVTSTHPGEGKTQTAANLAVSLAMEHRRVILVDANLRNPALHRLFQVDSSLGLADVLEQRSTLDEALQQTSVPFLKLLPAGRPGPNSADMLNSPAISELLLRLNAQADYVIFDSPDVGLADVQILASKVDGILYVVEEGSVTRPVLRRSIEQLQRAEANLLGVALTQPSSVEDFDFQATSYSTRSDEDGEGNFRDDTVAGSSKALDLSIRGRIVTAPEDPFAQRTTIGIGSLGRDRAARHKTGLIQKIALACGVLLLFVLAIQALRRDKAPLSAASQTGDGVLSSSIEGLHIADTKGQVEYWPASENAEAWQAASAGTGLGTSVGLRTAEETAALLQLGQSGVLRVGAKTQLKLRQVSKQEYSVEVKGGKVWLWVKPEGGHRVQVQTQALLLASTGGAFSVASNFDGALTMASTYRGKVTAQQGDRGIELGAGRAIRVRRQQAGPLTATAQQPAAQRMWQILTDRESWLQPSGQLRLGQG